MINVIFNDLKCEILPKQLETYNKYCKILQWGRQHPTRFLEEFVGIMFTDHQKYVILSSWVPANVVWLCSRASGKSFMSAPFIMGRSLLFPNHNTYIMGPSGGQAIETMTKLENLAKGNIASVLGVTSFFLDECVKMNAKADPFTHDKAGHHVALYNGSTVNTLNSVAKNIVGIRSNLNVYDEGGKIDRTYYSLTLPFSVQNSSFVVGKGMNTELFPQQLPNKNLILSSAEGIDSFLFDQYKICFNKMLLGDPDYFVADLDCNFSLHPFMDGKPFTPLISQAQVDDAFATNPYKASREYMNIFDQDSGPDVFVKRSTINRNTKVYVPVFEREDGKTYIVAYDPSTKIDNSFLAVAELFEDEEKGLMVKFVYARNLVEPLKDGSKAVIQKPQQIEILKDIICDFNKGEEDYNAIDYIIIDAGAGGLKLKPPHKVIYVIKFYFYAGKAC